MNVKLRYYVVKRLFLMVPLLFGLLTITFFVSHVMPGDPLSALAGENPRPEQVETLRREWGFDRPLWEQYGIYVTNLLHLNLGKSTITLQPVLNELLYRFPATFELTTVAMIISISLGLLLGTISAVKKDKPIDYCSSVFAVAGLSTPLFWLGILFQFIFYGKFDLLPYGGRISVPNPPHITGLLILDSLLTGNLEALRSSLAHIIMPALCLSTASLASTTRFLRATMLEILDQDYIKTARAYGISERKVIYKYALRNALIPVIATISLAYGASLGGSVLVETIFAWPGMGKYLVAAVVGRDFNSIVAVTLVLGVIFSIVNLIADISYAYLDPRVRYG